MVTPSRAVFGGLAIAAVTLTVMGCPAPPSPPDAQVDLDAGADDAGLIGVHVVLDTARAITAQLDQSGGTIDVDLGGGLSVAFSVPPDALAAPTDITVTPVQRIEGLPEGVAPGAAVQLAPDGLVLRRPASLSFPFAAAPGAFAYQWAEDFVDAHLTPFEEIDGGVVVTVMHFSGAGLATGDASFAQGGAATTASFISQYAQLLAEAKAAGVLPWYDQGYQTRFAGLWLNWSRVVVDGALTAAGEAGAGEATLLAAERAGGAAAAWRCALAQWEEAYFSHRSEAPPGWVGPVFESTWSGDYSELGLPAGLGQELDTVVARFTNLIAEGIQDAACRALQKNACAERPYVERAIRWGALAQILSRLGRRDGPAVEAPDLDTWCGSATDRYVMEFSLVASTGSTDVLTLQVGGGAALFGGGYTLGGAPLPPPATWSSSAPDIASVHYGAVRGRAVGAAVITAALPGGCVSDSLRVAVRRREQPPETYALSGEVSMGGAWTNGCPPARLCNQCSEGAFLTSYGGSWAVEVIVTGGSGNATAYAGGVMRACCPSAGDLCEGEATFSVDYASSSVLDGRSVHFGFGGGLTINGVVRAPPDAPPGSRYISGTATFLAAYCTCEMSADVILTE